MHQLILLSLLVLEVQGELTVCWSAGRERKTAQGLSYQWHSPATRVGSAPSRALALSGNESDVLYKSDYCV